MLIFDGLSSSAGVLAVSESLPVEPLCKSYGLPTYSTIVNRLQLSPFLCVPVIAPVHLFLCTLLPLSLSLRVESTGGRCEVDLTWLAYHPIIVRRSSSTSLIPYIPCRVPQRSVVDSAFDFLPPLRSSNPTLLILSTGWPGLPSAGIPPLYFLGTQHIRPPSCPLMSSPSSTLRRLRQQQFLCVSFSLGERERDPK